jgi:hypothetical protein
LVPGQPLADGLVVAAQAGAPALPAARFEMGVQLDFAGFVTPSG